MPNKIIRSIFDTNGTEKKPYLLGSIIKRYLNIIGVNRFIMKMDSEHSHQFVIQVIMKTYKC